jgi:hypothetical protein
MGQQQCVLAFATNAGVLATLATRTIRESAGTAGIDYCNR